MPRGGNPVETLCADATLGRGELRLHGESVRIDGTLAARLQSVLESTATHADGGVADGTPADGRR